MLDGGGQAVGFPENTVNLHEDLDKVKLIEYYLNNKEGSQLSENLQKTELSDGKSIKQMGIDIILSTSLSLDR
ncbi:nuclear receptor coactivator 7-like [Lynx pardinus]|uniref:Nuclear receptor coactivator 7-like n=1 Tax=Lynx pardinus TaxID=191816 RepID=A0A485NPG0_LYNPA|nr:nuclear receptor coactivator 7-like [Lynx pardinus]